jgi:hypothetical protein
MVMLRVRIMLRVRVSGILGIGLVGMEWNRI